MELNNSDNYAFAYVSSVSTPIVLGLGYSCSISPVYYITHEKIIFWSVNTETLSEESYDDNS